MKPTVYIFRGAPASGKGTVVPKFCELLPKPVALISQDTLRWGFHLIGRNILDVKDSEHMFAYRNTVMLYEQYLKNSNYSVVVEGLFTWDNIYSSQGNVKDLIDLAKQHGYQVSSIVLKADKAELLQRNSERDFVTPTEEFEILFENIYNKVDDSEIVLESTNQSVAETLKALQAIIPKN